MAALDKSCLDGGLREVPKMREPKTVPIPAPAPAEPVVAEPPPVFLAASKSMSGVRPRHKGDYMKRS